MTDRALLLMIVLLFSPHTGVCTSAEPKLTASDRNTPATHKDEAAVDNTVRFSMIAHRGGVVDGLRIENNIGAIEEAVSRGYYMIEVDIRESKDGILVVHHDENFARYYNDPRKVSELTWEEIQTLRSQPGDLRPLNFEEFVQRCSGRIHLMLDTKDPIHSKLFFERMETILRKYRLLDSALVIGTSQSKEFFAGKAKTAVSATQFRELLNAGRLNGKDQFLFAHAKDLDAEIVDLAQDHQIVVVPSVNIFHYPPQNHAALAAVDLVRLKNLGITHFQIDSEYDKFLTND